MLHEKQKRPPKFYIKLEDENPFSITWLSEGCKACKLFASADECRLWLKSEQAIRFKSIGIKLKEEHYYIYRSKIGPIIDIDTNRPVFDVYSRGDNVAPLDNDIINAENKLRHIKSRVATSREKKARLESILKEIKSGVTNAYVIARESRQLADEIDVIARDLYKTHSISDID